MTIESVHGRPLNLQRVMAMLYRSGISCGVESNWDDGFTVWLGYAEEAKSILHTHSLEEAASWLDRTARLYFPLTAYAAR